MFVGVEMTISQMTTTTTTTTMVIVMPNGSLMAAIAVLLEWGLGYQQQRLDAKYMTSTIAMSLTDPRKTAMECVADPHMQHSLTRQAPGVHHATVCH